MRPPGDDLAARLLGKGRGVHEELEAMFGVGRRHEDVGGGIHL